MTEPLRCIVTAIETGHLVSVVGEVDLATAPQLAESLVQFANGDVTVDLTQVTFLDSTGLHALVTAHEHLERRAARLRVTGASTAVLRVLEISGLDRYLQIDGRHAAA